MKKTVSLVLASILGGILTLLGYYYFSEQFQINTRLEAADSGKIIQTKFVPATTYEAEATDFTKAAAETLNAVVHVKNRTTYTPNTLEFFFGNGRTQEVVGTGSGVIISPDGYIVTNNHVIKGASDIEITLNNNKMYKAEVIGTHPNSDIALVKIDASNLPFITFADSDNVRVGEWVLAVGNPFNLTSTVTAGIVSAKGRDIHLPETRNRMIESFIQTDAAVNPGNSGGALVNTRGELIGINTAISSQTGSYVGYSFAVPSNIAKKVVEDLMEFGDVKTAYLGIVPLEVNGETSKELGLKESEGVLVKGFSTNSRAERAGLEVNDIIIGLDDVKVSKYSNLEGFLSAKRPGDVVNVKVLRDGVEKEFKVRLSNQFGNETIGELDFSKYLIGDLKKIPKSLANEYRLNFGVQIVKLRNNFLKNKISEGDVILRIGEHRVRDVKEVESALRKYKGKDVSIQLLNKEGFVDYLKITVYQ
ncbi:trypsin-like peptidase domain-containing protein [Flavobacteriaceae bacterium F08102]|nr:trypsin-like peptidase domain-containing protein [Flavobacteriaceae bacterium F08102]